jgi:hypothetical protein
LLDLSGAARAFNHGLDVIDRWDGIVAVVQQPLPFEVFHRFSALVFGALA